MLRTARSLLAKLKLGGCVVSQYDHVTDEIVEVLIVARHKLLYV
jgi:hypothetical protein